MDILEADIMLWHYYSLNSVGIVLYYNDPEMHEHFQCITLKVNRNWLFCNRAPKSKYPQGVSQST